MLRSSLGILLLSLALVACGGGNDNADSGTAGDAGGDAGTVGTDSGMRDSGSTPGDECATDEATATVGCNGFFSTEPAMDAAFGTCTPGTDTEPAGSCSGAGTLCYAGENAPEGWCHPACAPADTYVSTGSCPTGSRCFTLDTDFALCFRDCDDTHPCPTGMTCDGENSCIPDDAAPTDGGLPMDDGGVLDDGGVIVDDGGVIVDDGGVVTLPDAGDLLPDAGIPG